MLQPSDSQHHPFCLHTILPTNRQLPRSIELFRPGIVHAVQFVGMNEGSGSGSDGGGLALNGHCNGALHEQKEFLMHVPVRRMGFVSRSQNRFVYFQVFPGVEKTVKDRPGFVLPILLYRQFADRAWRTREPWASRQQRPKRRPGWGSPAEVYGGLDSSRSPCHPGFRAVTAFVIGLPPASNQDRSCVRC